MPGDVLRRLVEAVRPSLGEAVEEAAAAAAERLGGEAARLSELAGRVLEEALGRGLLRPVEPRGGAGPGYGVDGGLARLRRGSRVVAVLHAVAVGPGFERHVVRVLVLPAAGPEADAAVEASLSLLEAAVLASVPRGSLVFLDGPLADPPWVPPVGPLLEAAGEQLLGPGGGGALAGLHGARAEAMRGLRVVGVVKRLTGEQMLSGLLGLPAGLGDDALAAALAAGLRRRGLEPHIVGPVEQQGPVYEPYRARLGGVWSAYVLDARGPRGYRVEAAGGPGAVVEAAGAALASAVPPAWLPEEVLAAHRLAKPPVGLVRAALRAAAAEAAGDEVAEAVYMLVGGD